jgi:uncharacterized membrane protein
MMKILQYRKVLVDKLSKHSILLSILLLIWSIYYAYITLSKFSIICIILLLYFISKKIGSRNGTNIR